MAAPNSAPLPFETAAARAGRARTRQQTYSLLGRLYLNGLTPTLLPSLRPRSELAQALPAALDPDEAAADHYALFGLNVFAYESFFLGDDGLLGGPVTDALLGSYRRLDYEAGLAAATPDQLGNELLALAFLSDAEANGSEQEPAGASSWRRPQHTFFQDHLLRWLPPLVAAVQRQGNSFYSALAGVTLASAGAHYGELLAESATPPPRSFQLAPAEMLADGRTRPRQIAATLTTPAASGFYLSRKDVNRLARRLRLPHGFGGRSQLLANLLDSASHFEQLPTLLAALAAEGGAWAQTYGAQAAAWPALAPFIGVWQERLAQTIGLLAELKRQAETNDQDRI